MDFYYAGRDHRFDKKQQQRKDRQQQQHQDRQTSGGEFRFIKVVDALTYSKKSIFFNIIQQRKDRKGVVKNVWISNGDVFIRRFGATSAEPVKNQEFVDLLFQSHQEEDV
jgi:hypothetical protein